MNAKDIDPSLRAGEPLLESLDDGFSPPREPQPAASAETVDPAGEPAPPAPASRSPF